MSKRLPLLIAKVALMSVMFIVGVVFIFSAPAAGERMGHRAVVRNGGSMDGNIHARIVQSNTTAFNTAGMVLAVVGGIGFIASTNAIIKELD